MHSNHTETSAKVLSKRAAYLTVHREYIAYLQHLLDTATLPASEVPLPNMTTMAAMVGELRAIHAPAPWLNSIVLGRVLHRVLPSPLLTWHGGQHSARHLPARILIILETTIYRFPELGRARAAFELFGRCGVEWSNDFDQWQWSSRNDLDWP